MNENELDEPKELQEFYAVTLGESRISVYRASKGYNGLPIVRRIASRGNGRINIGETLQGGCGHVLAVCSCLVMYVPKGVRRMVGKARFWASCSPPIAALLDTEQRAMACFANHDLTICDLRWEEATLRIIKEIGDEHSVFEVCRHPPWLALPFLATDGRLIK